MEQRVKERTAALVKTNQKLRREIEERRHAESALRESEMQLRAAQEIAHVGSYVIDIDEERLHWSEEQFRIFGYEPGEVMPDLELVRHHLHPDDLQRFEKAHEMAFYHDKAYNHEYRILRKDGAVRHVRAIARIEHDEEGKPRRMFGTLQDITETKLLERHLLQSEKLASMGLLVSGIAHEINNPNNFITFNIPILRDYLKELIPIVDAYGQNHQDREWCGMSYPEFRKDIFNLVDNVEHSATRINNIVSGLREFGRKKDHITLRRIDLKKVIERVVTICQGEINKRVKSFEVNVSERLPLIKTDPEIMEQILINLLINAAQAADKKNSWVKLDVGSKNPGEGYLALEVSDNGCGISDEDRKRIFDPFFTTKSPQEGTGLGLSITYSLIEGLGGRIEVESEMEKGTTFTVMLPTTKAEDPLEILVVDDDRVIRSVVSKALASVGRYQVKEASSGTEACIQIGNNRPDLLILDIQMPDMDGVEVCRLIKKKPELASIKLTFRA